MSYKIITIFGVYGNDERGIVHGDCKEWFSTEAGARLGARGKGDWGDGTVMPSPAIKVGDEVFPVAPVKVNDTYEKRAALINSAKGKLSAEERNALGL